MYLLRRDLPQILEIRCDMAVTKDYTVSQKAEYLQTIVNSLKRMGKERDMSQRFLVSARLLASEDSLSLVERFRLISGGQEPRRLMAASLVTGALCLLFVSYLFIVQSAYEPGEQDYLDISSNPFLVVDFGEAYLVKHSDGKYSLVTEGGTTYVVDDQEVIADFLESNFVVLEE